MYTQSTFLDTETGEVVWLFEDDEEAEMAAGVKAEENKAVGERIDTSPER